MFLILSHPEHSLKQKHLVHLKAIRTMSPIPPESADTPLSNPGNIRNEATSTSSNTHTASSSSSTSISISFSYRKEDQIQSSFDQSRQDEEFAAILQNFTDRQRTLPSPRARVPPSRRKHSLERDETTSEEKKAPKKRRTKSGDST